MHPWPHELGDRFTVPLPDHRSQARSARPAPYLTRLCSGLGGAPVGPGQGLWVSCSLAATSLLGRIQRGALDFACRSMRHA